MTGMKVDYNEAKLTELVVLVADRPRDASMCYK
jgi:hypothetical protein